VIRHVGHLPRETGFSERNSLIRYSGTGGEVNFHARHLTIISPKWASFLTSPPVPLWEITAVCIQQ